MMRAARTFLRADLFITRSASAKCSRARTTTGAQAVELLSALRFDLVFADVAASEIDGLQLCRELKHDLTTRDIPVIVFSMLSAETRAKEAGANAFLRKPLVASVLLGTIRRLAALEAHSLTESQ